MITREPGATGDGGDETPASRIDDPYRRLRPAPPTPADEICSCVPARPLMMSALGENPVHCLDCNGEVEPASVPLAAALVNAVADWSRVAMAIHALELDSGPYERWAQSELMNLASPVNQQGLEVRRLLDQIRRCHYVLFQPLDRVGFTVPRACPGCGGPFAAYTAGQFPRLTCESCGLVLVNLREAVAVAARGYRTARPLTCPRGNAE